MPPPPPDPGRDSERPKDYAPPELHHFLRGPGSSPPTPPPRTIRVVVIDDHPVIRDAVGRAVADRPDMALAGAAGTAADAFALVRAADPDVAVVDVALADAHGLDLVRNLLAERPALAVVVFSMYDEAVYAERALRAGARAYVRKTEPTAAVAEAVRAAAAGEIYLARAARAASSPGRARGQRGGRSGRAGVRPRRADGPGDGRVRAARAGAGSGGHRGPPRALAEDGRDVPSSGEGEARGSGR